MVVFIVAHLEGAIFLDNEWQPCSVSLMDGDV